MTLIELAQYSLRVGVHKSCGSRIPLHDGISTHALHRTGHSRWASFRITATWLLHTCASRNNSSKHAALSGTPLHNPAGVVAVVVVLVLAANVIVDVLVVERVGATVVAVVVEMQESQRTGQFKIKNRAISGVERNGLQKSADTPQSSIGSGFPSQVLVVMVVVVVMVVLVVIVPVEVVDVNVGVVVVDVLSLHTLQMAGQCFCAIVAIVGLMDSSQMSVVTPLHSVSSSSAPLQNRLHKCQLACPLGEGVSQLRWQSDFAVAPVNCLPFSWHMRCDSSMSSEHSRQVGVEVVVVVELTVAVPVEVVEVAGVVGVGKGWVVEG